MSPKWSPVCSYWNRPPVWRGDRKFPLYIIKLPIDGGAARWDGAATSCLLGRNGGPAQ
jgi:hypothetical protein